MRLSWLISAVLCAAPMAAAAQAEAPEQLVREVVYNEQHDHQRHGYWRYWIAQQSEHQNRLSEQVETADGPIARTMESGGHPLSADAQQQEAEKLRHVAESAGEQAKRRQEYAEDEHRIGRILALLPDAFLFEDGGEEKGFRKLRFRPNPDYPARSVEARVFHAMSGEIWVDARMKRLARLEGHLGENVDFGYGLLGRLYKGGWFLLEREAVSETDWKTVRLEIHMNGRALLFKTIARETSERRGGFEAVPAGLTMAQGILLLGVGAQPQEARGGGPSVEMPLHAAALGVRQ